MSEGVVGVAVEVWRVVDDERTALAQDLAGLSEAQWHAPSLCAGWSVRDVVAHLASTGNMTPPRFFLRMAANRFNFERMLATFYSGSNLLIGAKKRLTGLRLDADDAEWSLGSPGDPAVRGPLISVILAMTGRRSGCDALTGPGVDTLRSRCA